MGGLDLILALVLAFGLWRGLRTGALMQIVGTAGWLFAFVAATALMAPIGEMVAASLGVSPRTAPILGFIVVCGGVVAGLTAPAATPSPPPRQFIPLPRDWARRVRNRLKTWSGMPIFGWNTRAR